MKTNIRRIVDKNDVYKQIIITTEKDEVVFDAKLYVDLFKFQAEIDENELIKKIVEIPDLLKVTITPSEKYYEQKTKIQSLG
jgi:hypothetical protein